MIEAVPWARGGRREGRPPPVTSWVSGWRGTEIPCGWYVSREWRGGCGAHPAWWVGDGHMGEDEGELVPVPVG